jgi:very-short-patch-repair endonuclease
MGDDRQLAFAKRMRREPSATERLLWKILRDRKLGGMKFRRQVPVGRYIVDFLCLRHRLIIEADGPFHDPDYDAARDAWLRAQGFRVLRFTNAQIDRAPGLVLAAIERAVEAPMSNEF